MRKEIFKNEENTHGTEKTDVNGDNLDLLNLRFKFSNDPPSNRERRQQWRKDQQRRTSGQATGDDYCRHYNVKQERRTNHYNPSGDTSDVGQRPCRGGSSNKFSRNEEPNEKGDDPNVVCLYNNRHNFAGESRVGGVVDEDDFLLPRHQRTRPSRTAPKKSSSEESDRKQNGKEAVGTFPFRHTSSGNLKIRSRQVVYESDKFSILVADPDKTKISISDKRTAGVMQKDSEYTKNSAINAIMKQGLGSSLDSFLIERFPSNAPTRKEKESSEYEGKATNEILDPELNLNRLGYTAADPIDWNDVVLPEKKNLYLELYSRITNFTNADCKVYIDNEEFNCHLLVLQCYSEVFHTYVAVKKVELPSDKCSPTSFAFIYEWMITGDPSYRELNRENVLDIFNAAKYLKIKDLIEQCWAFIDNPDVFSEDTAFLLYIDAKEKNLPEVRELMLPRIEKFFLMLVSSQDWLELELEDVQNFLQSNYICVNCEMEVFMSAVRWLKHDWEHRDPYKTAVLSCVRFGNLAPWQLVDIRRNPDNPEFRDLAKDPEICKMIEDGLAYVIIHYWYGPENDDYQHWNSMLKLKEPPARNWSGTEKTYFTYREFLIYLDQYRRSQMIEKSKPREKKPLPRHPEGGSGNGRVSPRDSAERINVKMPTIDEFLSTRKNPEVQRRMSRRKAVGVIERAYKAYRIRKNVRGLGQRLARHVRRRSNISVIRRVFELPKKHSSGDNKRSDEATAAQLAQRNRGLRTGAAAWTRPPQNVMRLQIPNEIEIKNSKNTRLDYQPRSPVSQSVLSKKERDYETKCSLYHLEYESVLVFGGINVHTKYGVGRNTGKDIYRYHPDLNGWKYVGEMPAPRTHHCVAFLLGRIYVVGGSDPREDDVKGKFVVVDTVWSLEPIKKIWFTEGSLIVKRKNFGLVVFGRTMFAIGGQDRNSRVTDSVEMYNSKNSSWTFVAPMRHPRMGIACTKFEERIWVGGGMCGSSHKPLTDSVECYDVRANQWTEVTRLRVPRCFATFFTMSNRLYLIAGAGRNDDEVNGTVSFNGIDVWNAKTKRWEPHTEMEVARHGHTTAYLGTQILIIGGVTTLYMRSLCSIECFCVSRGLWIRGMSTLPNCLSGHATVTLPPAILM